MQQATVARTVRLESTSIEDGERSIWEVMPAEEDTGIRFMDSLRIYYPTIEADYFNVKGTLGTLDLSKGYVTAKSVEHIMSILHGVGITNAVVAMTTACPPEDTKVFAEKILKNKREQESLVNYFMAPSFNYERNSSHISVIPDIEKFVVSCGFYFANDNTPEIQQYKIEVNPKTYIEEIADARTFCTYDFLYSLQRNNKGLGASEKNCIVVPDYLDRFWKWTDKTEMVRHKILDFIGDIYLIGRPVRGRFHLVNPTHSTTYLFIKEIMGVS